MTLLHHRSVINVDILDPAVPAVPCHGEVATLEDEAGQMHVLAYGSALGSNDRLNSRIGILGELELLVSHHEVLGEQGLSLLEVELHVEEVLLAVLGRVLEALEGNHLLALCRYVELVYLTVSHSLTLFEECPCEAQSPESGRGLECDKLSREAVLKFWQAYPQMLIDLAGHHAGTTFTHFEIDSYEAGGQSWSGVLPAEFEQRRGYNLRPYIPYMLGRCKTVGDKQLTDKFKKDWQKTIQELFAENYYGYLAELTRQTPGMNLLIEPYGTGGQRPFRVLDIYKILEATGDAVVATEFWTYPNWGWKDMGQHEKVMRNLQRPILYAEAFTCWPLKAWQDDPQSLKAVCDRAYCTGVNRMMLHAGAANPWQGVEPGMSFGFWGTQFVPGQTWWKAGGAKQLFAYMARCQSLLQRGVPAKEQLPALPHFKSYRRTDGDTDIYFFCNPTATAATDTLPLTFDGRSAEVWNPYTKEMYACTGPALTIEPYGSRFVILRTGISDKAAPEEHTVVSTIPIGGSWVLSFPEVGTIVTDTLCSWTTLSAHDMKYFSGTATYSINLRLKKKQLRDKDARYILSLGEVKNMA